MRLEFEREKFHKTHRLQEIRIKWISGLVAVMTAIITAGTSITIALLETSLKDREIQLQNSKNEQDYIQGFVSHALNSDLQQRIDFAQYVAMVSISPTMRSLWLDYHQLLEKEYQETRADLRGRVKELSEEIKKAKGSGQDPEGRIVELEQEIALLRRRISGPDIPEGDLTNFFQHPARTAFEATLAGTSHHLRQTSNLNPCLVNLGTENPSVTQQLDFSDIQFQKVPDATNPLWDWKILFTDVGGEYRSIHMNTNPDTMIGAARNLKAACTK